MILLNNWRKGIEGILNPFPLDIGSNALEYESAGDDALSDGIADCGS